LVQISDNFLPALGRLNGVLTSYIKCKREPNELIKPLVQMLTAAASHCSSISIQICG